MIEKNLRSKLIRLAHANPELRKEVLPLLTKTASDAVWNALAKGSLTTKGVEVTIRLTSQTVIKTPSQDWGLHIEGLTPTLAAVGAEQISLATTFMDAIVKASQKAPDVWGFTFKSFSRSDNGYGSDPMGQIGGTGLYVTSKPRFHLEAKVKSFNPQADLEKFNAALLKLSGIWF